MIFQKFLLHINQPQTILFCLLPAIVSLSGNTIAPLIVVATLLVLVAGLFVSFKFQKQDDSTERRLQEEILQLKQLVSVRDTELNNMRASLAEDFHDETGNLLSVLMHQANILKLKAPAELQPEISNILESTCQLYASSRDFLWYIQTDDQDAVAVFNYLTDFGQSYFGKFDVDFSVENNAIPGTICGRLNSSSVINLVFIFKEAMTNVVKHSAASEVKLLIDFDNYCIRYALIDDGYWKEKAPAGRHHGIQNMTKRCQKNGFNFEISTNNARTRIDVVVPYQLCNN